MYIIKIRITESKFGLGDVLETLVGERARRDLERMDLDRIQPTQESLASTAGKVLSSMAPDVFRDQWRQAFTRSSPSHRLTLLYLANEICQRGKRTKPEFLSTHGLGGLLPWAFQELIEQKPEFKDKILRIIQVWSERNVFTASELDTMRRSAQGGGGISNKRPRMSPMSPYAQSPPTTSGTTPGSMSPGVARQSPPAGAGGDALLSLNPAVSSLAKAASSASLDVDDLLLSGQETGQGAIHSYLMDIIKLSRELPVPESMASLFQLISESERDSIKFELDQENQERLGLKLYKLLKTLLSQNSSGQSGAAAIPMNPEELQACIDLLKDATFAQKLDADEAKMRTDAAQNPDLFELVQTEELVSIDLKAGLKATSQRKEELEVEVERDQQILLGLSEFIGEFEPEVHSVREEKENRDSQTDELTKQITELEELVSKVQAKLEQEEQRVSLEQQSMLATMQQQMGAGLGGFPPYYAPPSTGSEEGGASRPSNRPRKQRWGEPTAPAPQLLPPFIPMTVPPGMPGVPPSGSMSSYPPPPAPANVAPVQPPVNHSRWAASSDSRH